MTASSRGIVCLSTVDWDFLWLRQQEVMSHFAAAGTPVLYVEPLGIRSARLGDARKVLKRLRRRVGQGSRPLAEIAPGLHGLSPLALPFQGYGAVDRLNRWLVARSIRGAAGALAMDQTVLWMYYATRVALGLIDDLKPAVVVYDCIDDVAHNPKGVVQDYAATERALLRRADLVLTTSTRLYDDKRGLSPHTYFVPPGADVDRFAAPATPPAELAGLPRPRICFFGGIDERLDLAMLADIARRRPDWTIILLGVVRTDVSALAGLANIFFIGQQRHDDLPGYVQHMDVLLLPYVINDYTERIYPAKIFECLATGKPVLATALPDLAALAGPVRVLAGHEDPVAAIDQLMGEDSPEKAQLRLALARANSWDARFRDIQLLLAEAIAGKDDPR